MAQHQRTYKRLQRARPDFDEQCSVVSYLVRHLDVISGDEFFMGNALSNRVQILFIATIGPLSIIVPVLTQQLKQNQVTPLFESATHAKQPCCASVNMTLSLWDVFIL